MKPPCLARACTTRHMPLRYAEQGLTATEYAALAAVLIVLLLAAVRSLGGGLVQTAEQASHRLSGGPQYASAQSTSAFKLARTDPNPPAREIKCAEARRAHDELSEEMRAIEYDVRHGNASNQEVSNLSRRWEQLEALRERVQIRVNQFCN